MAVVYLARDVRLDRRVALKVMSPELASGLGTDRFLREIRVTARLDHPHILPILDSGEDAGLLWYTMPFVEGETLRGRLHREIQLPVDDAVRLAREIADALVYAHQHGVVHRDIKPENILLSNGHSRVADFGVARAFAEAGDARLTETGMAVGTPAYMSPEQASGGQVDARTDVYALGCVLYEMLTGEPPYTGPTPQAILMKRLSDSVPSARRLRESVPRPLDEALTRSLAKLPGDRFRTAAEFSAALGQPSLETIRVTTGRGSWRDVIRSRRTRLALVSVCMVLLAVVLAGQFWRSRTSRAALDSDLLAVAPFDVLEPKLQLWREGLVDLLSRNLDGAGPLRTVPPTAVMRRWTGHADPLSASELGRRTGARLALFGSLVPAGNDSVRVRATLLDVDTDRPLAELELEDHAGRVDRLGDSLAVRILGELGRNRRLELTRVASLGSTSPASLKAFLQGEQWFRRAAWDSALVNYERAVALDSGFALALWRLGRVVGWQRVGFDSLAEALTLRAGALNRGLAPRDSLLVAVDSMLMGGVRGTQAGHRRLTETALEATRRYPDDADAWQTLGEVYVHTRKVVPQRPALQAFERAIALDSAYAPAYIHAIELASSLHGIELARRYAAEYLRRAPGDLTGEGIRLAFDLATPPGGDTVAVQRRLERASPNVLLKAWLPVSGATDSGEVGVRIGRAFAGSAETVDPWLPMEFRRAANMITLISRGHLREAAEHWGPDLFFSSRLLASLALSGACPVDSADARFGRWLRAGDLQNAVDGLSWWAARGDFASIKRLRRLADSMVSTSDTTQHELGIFAVKAADAYLTLARRDTANAVRLFEDLQATFITDGSQEFLTSLRLRAARGEDRRVLQDAEEWMAVWPLTEAWRQLEGARAAERLGERERGARAYQYVVDAWRHADPELQQTVAEAREGLKRLAEERSGS
jgi:serine/threonine-protein kinase